MDTLDKSLENTEKTPGRALAKKPRPPRLIYPIFILTAIAGIFIAKFVLDTLAPKAKKETPPALKASLPGPAPVKTVKPLPEAEKLPQAPLPPVLVQKKNPPPAFTLSGIFYDDKLPCALIDNKIVKEGDVISGAKVIRIMPNGVKLEFEGEAFELTTR